MIEPEEGLEGQGFKWTGRVHHVALELNGKLLDAEGSHTPEELLRTWRERMTRVGGFKPEHAAKLRLEPHNAARARESLRKSYNTREKFDDARSEIRRAIGK